VDPAAAGQQARYQPGHAGEQVLAVVHHENDVIAVQHRANALHHVLVGLDLDGQRRGERRWNEIRICDEDEVDEVGGRTDAVLQVAPPG
jgi:hypothetical protein